MDVFDYLPPGGINAISPPIPINLCCPQHAAYFQSRINVKAYGKASNRIDNSRSQVIKHSMCVGQYPVLHHQKLCLKQGLSSPLLQLDHYLSQTIDHWCLYGCAQFSLNI